MTSRMYGWAGRMLSVDLSTGSCNVEIMPDHLLHEYVGGRGLGVRFMRDYHRLDPFDSATPLIFAVGPLCGTSAPTASRLAIVTRSPLTGTIFDNSFGGTFAWQLKAAGYDLLKISGESPKPVILVVNESGAELLPAGSLWGSTVRETTAALKGAGSVAAIGPAGENAVFFASVMTADGSVSGRGGLGANMGRKRLKAIAVKGARRTDIAEPDRFESARADVMRLFRASPVIFGELGLAEYGTPAFVDLMKQRRMTPTENFHKTWFNDSDRYSGPALRKQFSCVKDGCFGCPVQCLKISSTGERLPEYEALSHFGALNGISDLSTIIQANSLCFELGMDPISTAATISAYGEMRGRFVTADELAGFIKDIAFRKGDGDCLANGSRSAAIGSGHPETSMNVKGLELSAYDPRGAYGMALSYCTGSRGGCHQYAYPVSTEILRKPVATDRFSFSGKARIISIAEDTNAAVDSLAACKFAFFGATLEEYAGLLTSTTGVDYTPQRLKEIGARICLTERYYNCANGFDISQDQLPDRFFTEAGSAGDGIDIPPLNRYRFNEELQKYYRIRGLSPQGTFADPHYLEQQP